MKNVHVLVIPNPAQGHVSPLLEVARCLTNNDLMQMLSIPDGMGPLDGEKITCIIADYCMGWVSKVAQKMRIRLATFCSGSAALMALIMSVQKLLDDQVIDNNRVPLKDQMIQLSTTMPSMNPAQFVWACVGDSAPPKEGSHGLVLDWELLEHVHFSFLFSLGAFRKTNDMHLKKNHFLFI
nr:UDP-glycosyltransferase 83A1-like [Tanacetum cinerariifolium]